MTSIVIKKVNKCDINEIVRIHKRCVSITNSKSYPVKNINEWLEQINYNNVTCQLKNSQWVIIKKERSIIGFSQFDIETDDLFQMQIDPDYQGQGYGKMLYEFIELKFKKSKRSKILLYSTINAVSFYKKFGFIVIKPIKLKMKTVYNDLFEMEKKLRY
jgi:ribosomal protein S18 acetylase RimI-like enzyme